MMSLTYGQLPTQEQFDFSFTDLDSYFSIGGFMFRNDKRVGTIVLSRSELWKELNKAVYEWGNGDNETGDWCSCVLQCLGFEWI